MNIITLQYISTVFASQANIRRFTAPSGMMYKIKGVQVTSFAAALNRLSITDRYVEEEIGFIPDSDGFFSFDLAIDGNYGFMYFTDNAIESKYISIGLESPGTAVNLVVKVFYTLEKASMSDLVWAFITRGKKP